MTVQPQFPQYPQQPYAQQPMAPMQPYQAPPQQYGGQFPQAPQIPAQPLANGTLDDFYSQPSTGGGPAISWKGKPDGTTYVGIVARDVTHGDVQHDTDPQTQQPKYYRDGRPMFAMKVPLLVQTPEFPDGEVSLYVRGALRDELARAMSEAGAEGAPKQGDVLQVTLVGRKPGKGPIPKNVFAVAYQRQGAGAPSPAPAQPMQQQPVQQPAAQPVQQVAQAAPVQQYAPAPQVQQFPPAQQPVVDQQVVAPVHPVQPMQQPVQQPVPQVAQAPAPQQQPLQPAPGISDEQAQLLARLTGQAPQG